MTDCEAFREGALRLIWGYCVIWWILKMIFTRHMPVRDALKNYMLADAETLPSQVYNRASALWRP